MLKLTDRREGRGKGGESGHFAKPVSTVVAFIYCLPYDSRMNVLR